MVNAIVLSSASGEVIWAMDTTITSKVSSFRANDYFFELSHLLQTTSVSWPAFHLGVCYPYTFKIKAAGSFLASTTAAGPAAPDNLNVFEVDCLISNVGGIFVSVYSLREQPNSLSLASNTDVLLLENIGEQIRISVKGSSNYQVGSGAAALANEEQISPNQVLFQLAKGGLTTAIGNMVQGGFGSEGVLAPAMELVDKAN